MAETDRVLEYKCPCCGAGLSFGSGVQKMTCAYCDNTFDLDTIQAYYEETVENGEPDFQWDDAAQQQWNEAEQETVRAFQCPSCGGQILTDENTAATFCPYCENPAVIPGRVSGGLRPDAVMPFKTTKEDAKAAFLNLCKGKPLLPKLFTQEQHLEKISGIYVPFWLYDCGSTLNGKYKATRVRHWSNARYEYTKTDHFLLHRNASADFGGIPMDGSRRMDNAIMESIEPFDYGQVVDFETAYLSGFFADKYDVEAKEGEDRIRQRVGESMEDMLQSSFKGYSSVIPMEKHLNVRHSRAKYVLLPVWMLHTRYRDKTYVFAMNGQTGKMTGSFPICPKRTAAWFAGVCAGVTALVSLVQLFVL